MPHTEEAAPLTDDAIITRAQEILERRCQEAAQTQQAELKRLYARYVSPDAPHTIGTPKKLTQHEALLLCALEANKYTVEIEQVGSLWHGDATCRFHARGTAMALRQPTRLDVLMQLWASVSGQYRVLKDGTAVMDTVRVDEDHLQGSVFRQDIRDLERQTRKPKKRKPAKEAPASPSSTPARCHIQDSQISNKSPNHPYQTGNQDHI